MKNNYQDSNFTSILLEKSNDESLIHALLSAIPSFIYVYDIEKNKYVFVSEKIAALLGYRVEDVKGFELATIQSRIHLQDLDIIVSALSKLVQANDNQGIAIEYRVKNKKEQWYWVKDEIKVFSKNEAGRVNKIIGSVTDMTALKDAEKDIQKLTRHYAHYNQRLKEQNEALAEHEKKLMATNEELVSQQEDLKMAFQAISAKNNELDEANEILTAQKNEMSKVVKELSDRNFELDQFVYKVSHDIRSPFTSILGLVNLMKMETDPTRLMQSVAHIEKSVLKLDTFVKSMLDFARISRKDFKPEEIFFYILIDDCLNDYKYLENFKKIAIQINIQENENKFYSDALQVNSIFRNVISNAIKYANSYSKNSFLNIDINITSDFANITLTDNGIGIKEEYLDKVFGMFVRSTEKSDGSGLGLYIVKQSLERLKGNIEIQSKYGEGTILKIQIPNLYATLPTYQT